MRNPNDNQTIDLKVSLVDLAHHRSAERCLGRTHDPLRIYAAYAQDETVYKNGAIVTVSPEEYNIISRDAPNELVNKFGRVYALDAPMLLHHKLADVLIGVAIDLYDRHGFISIVMDGLRTYDCAVKLQENRPDLVELGMLTQAGKSAHNRALAVDSKLFSYQGDMLVEVDECGHLDDLNMDTNSRFYQSPMSDTARRHRLLRLQAWQRASVKNTLPIANLLSEFWDDRVPGSPEDLWRVLACRALSIGMNAHPADNPIIGALKSQLIALHNEHHERHTTRQSFAEAAHSHFVDAWNTLFTAEHIHTLDTVLCKGASQPPALEDFIFHEWLNTIHDEDLAKAGFPRQLHPDLRHG